jgi:hypothetical protein
MPDINPFARKSPAHREAIVRVKDMARTHFRLSDDDVVLVTEIECGVPGCPPLETIIAFWTDETRRHHTKVFKPVLDVVEDDLPPWWMKDALVAEEVFGCPCC